jgi:hypothetical protein
MAPASWGDKHRETGDEPRVSRDPPPKMDSSDRALARPLVCLASGRARRPLCETPHRFAPFRTGGRLALLAPGKPRGRDCPAPRRPRRSGRRGGRALDDPSPDRAEPRRRRSRGARRLDRRGRRLLQCRDTVVQTTRRRVRPRGRGTMRGRVTRAGRPRRGQRPAIARPWRHGRVVRAPRTSGPYDRRVARPDAARPGHRGDGA